jgi:hypothetical protein
MATVSLAYGGTYAFTSCIMGFGAVVATGLGIVRKLMSVLLSFILFPKPFGVAHFLGLLSFFSGLLVAWSADYNKTVATGDAPSGGGSRSEGGEGSSGGSDSSDEESSGRVKKVRTSPRLAQMQQLKEGAKAAASGGGGSQSQHSQSDLPCGPQG